MLFSTYHSRVDWRSRVRTIRNRVEMSKASQSCSAHRLLVGGRSGKRLDIILNWGIGWEAGLEARSTNPGRDPDREGALGRSVRFLQPFDVSQQLLLAGHSRKVPAPHLERPQGRLATRPQRNQHAGQDRRLGL